MKAKFTTATPYIASFVILKRGSKIAMILRKNTNWMDGHFGLPAGKIEWGEPFSSGAVRETLEEVSVKVDQAKLRHVHTVHRHSEDSDWIDVYFEALEWEGEPRNAEPTKSERLEWIDIHDHSVKIVPAQLAAINEITKGSHYSEFGW